MRNPQIKLAALAIPLALSAAAASISVAEEVLTNDSVLAMHRAGLPASVIVAKIESTPCDFDTSVEALVTLSEAGVAGDVIAAMTRAGSPPPEPQPAAPSGTLVLGREATARPTAPARFRSSLCPGPGIFLRTGDDLREVDPSAYTATKAGGALLSHLTYGIKSVKSKVVLQGSRSHNLVTTTHPTFLFCFEETESGLSYQTSGATTPSQFLLSTFDVNPKQNRRELVIGKFNVYTGGQSGPPPKYTRDITYDKVSAGVYEVHPIEALLPGEYCFFYAGTAPVATYGLAPAGSGSGKVFDFSVSPGDG